MTTQDANTTPPARPVGRGRVQGLLFQVEPSTRLNVCRFQIERKNAKGEPISPVPVEMRSMSFAGNLNNGDWVELPDLWSPGRTLRPTKVTNLTTKATFESRGVGGLFHAMMEAYPGLMKVTMFFVGLVFAGVLAGFVVFLINARGSGTTSTPVGPTGQATIHMSTRAVSAGETITASGTGWRGGEALTFYYGPSAIGNAKADGRGSFTNATLTVPRDANGFFTDIRVQGSLGDSYDQAVTFSG